MKAGFIESAESKIHANELKEHWEKMLKGMGLDDRYKIVTGRIWINGSSPDHGRAVTGRAGAPTFGVFAEAIRPADTGEQKAEAS